MIVVYGTVCLDRVYQLPSLPHAGGYVEMIDERTSLGGEAANTAAALRLWGAETLLVGNSLGTGQDSDLLRALLSEHGLADARVPEGSEPAPVCHIMVTDDAERTMFGKGFAAMEQNGDPRLVPHVPGGWLTADPNHGRLARHVLTEAHENGMSTYALDFVRNDETLPQGCFWQSSTSWVGTKGDLDANKAWLERWIERFDCTAILTDGASGFLLGDRASGLRHLPPWPIERPIDSTGAGDVFRAGVLFGLAQDWDLAHCLAYASAAAALNCQGLGAIGGLSQRSVIEQLVRNHDRVLDFYQEAV